MNRKFDSVELQRKRREELSRKISKLKDGAILRFFNSKLPKSKQLKKAA
jgi:hypothetical protein